MHLVFESRKASFSSQCLIYLGSPIPITLDPVHVSSGVCLAIVFRLILLPFRNTTTLQQHPPGLQKGHFNIRWREVWWALWLPWWWQWPWCPDTLLVPGPSCCFWAWLNHEMSAFCCGWGFSVSTEVVDIAGSCRWTVGKCYWLPFTCWLSSCMNNTTAVEGSGFPSSCLERQVVWFKSMGEFMSPVVTFHWGEPGSQLLSLSLFSNAIISQVLQVDITWDWATNTLLQALASSVVHLLDLFLPPSLLVSPFPLLLLLWGVLSKELLLRKPLPQALFSWNLD